MKKFAADFQFSTLIELLTRRSVDTPERIAFTFLRDDGTDDVGRLTYEELDRKARAIAVTLSEIAVPGERAVLVYPAGLEFIAGFFGCLYAGVIPVPAPPPRRHGKNARLEAVVRDARPRLFLSTNSLITTRGSADPRWTNLHAIATDLVPDDYSSAWCAPPIEQNSLAILQYTSGSTTTPKGVMISHHNVLRNSEYIRRVFEHTQASVSVCWLPNYHDMGLIDGIIQPIYAGFPAFLMSPLIFLQRPITWLHAISAHRATHSGGPNFAYDLCVNKTTPEQRKKLDLSTWSTAYNGAEPVHSATLKRFVDTFSAHGFDSRSFYPCYGLAEATLVVAGGSIDDEPIQCTVQSAELRHHRAVEVFLPFEKATELVGCGRAQFETRIVIVDPESCRRVSAGDVGEIWVSGTGVAHGYWRRPQDTEAIFEASLADTGEGPFLRTGDLGFVKDGELFVTGRLKDVLIIRGQNHYPQDIEVAVGESHFGLRRGSGAAFVVMSEESEQLIIAQEVERTHLKGFDLQEMITAIRRAVAEQHELQCHGIVLLRPGTLPKTSSGKIQRHVCRSMYLAGTLSEVGRSVLKPEDHTATEIRTLSFEGLTPMEREGWLRQYVRQLVCEILRIPSSGWTLTQSPMELGFDSLTSVDLCHHMEKELNVNISPVDILGAESFEILTERLLDRFDNGLRSWTVPALAVAGQTGSFPLSAGQKALWYLHQLGAETGAYNVSLALRILSEVNPDAVRDTFQILIDRHSSLRASFTVIAGQPVQEIHRERKLSFWSEDASDCDEEDLNERLKQAANEPFHLEKDSLIRVRLYLRGQAQILLVTAHHLVIDFWSMVVLLNEFSQVYSALVQGKELRLPLPRSQFVDYVRWQVEMLAGPEGKKLAKYWHEQLTGAPAKLELCRGRSGRSITKSQGATHICHWDDKFVGLLNILAKSQRVTLYMLLLTAFKVLFHRYTGHTDILVGSSVAGRSRPEFAGLVGYVANQLVLRSQLRGTMKFSALLNQVKHTVLGALAHQDYPFSLLVERLQPTRNFKQSPFIQIMFVLEQPHTFQELGALLSRGPGATLDLGKLKVEHVALDRRQGEFDLSVIVFAGDSGLKISWEYDLELFDSQMIYEMSRNFETLLKAIIENPDQLIKKLPLLEQEERERLLKTLNQTEQPYPHDKTIQKLFEEQVSKTPDAIAVVDGNRSLTYVELNRRANQLARHLQALGVGPESQVGICLPRSLAMLVSIWAVLKAGAAYVPLDYSYPQTRLDYMLETAQVKVLLTVEHLVGKVPNGAWTTIYLDSAWQTIAGSGDENLTIQLLPDNLAYVIYTSGSSGRPKGTAITHRGLVNYVSWAMARYRVAEGTGAPVNSSFSFDATVTSLFCPLLAGKKIVLMPENEETIALAKALCSGEEFGLVKITPAQLQWLKSSWPPHQKFAGTKSFVIGGEQLRNKNLDFWHTHASNTKFINEYGPTESVVGCCCFEVEGLSTRPSDAVPIGRPIANVQIYLLDENFEPVPLGVLGEMYIGGAGLARGYVGLSALTAEKFVPDPFSGRAGARLYKTGDLARYLADGTIEYVGRSDDQLKIRGFRVELEEIRAVLLQHPAIRESAIKVMHTEHDENQLVAYFVTGPETADITTTELRRWLSERLPKPMVPAWFVSMNQLPLTPNGKVDKQLLPDPPVLRPQLDAEYVAPGDELESLIASIWRDLLRVDRVGIYDRFFDLGGHSLLLAQAHHRLQDALQQEIPITDLLQYPTVHSLSTRLKRQNLSDFRSIIERTEKQKRALTFQRKLMLGRHVPRQ